MHSLFLLLLSAGYYEISETVSSDSSAVTDLSEIYEWIQADFAKNRPWDYIGIGPVIYIHPGRYTISRTLEVCNQTTIRGAGGRGWGAPTRIDVKPGVTPILAKGPVECAGKGRGSSWSEFSDFGLVEVGTSTAERHGIEAHSRVYINRVWIRGFVHGIHISAGAQRTTEDQGNANGWGISFVTVENAEHNGIWVDGPDTNAGTAWSVHVTSACRQAPRWVKKYGPCAGVVDSTYFGALWAGVMVHHTQDVNNIRYPFMMHEGANQHSVVLAPYRENDQLDGVLAQHTMALGGLSSWSGTGLRFDGVVATNLIVRNARDPKNVVDTVMGNRASVGSFIEFHQLSAKTKPLRFKSDIALLSWRADVANGPAFLRISPKGKLWLAEPPKVGVQGLEAILRE